MEQSEKILKLHSIKSDKDVKFYQENGGLELSVSNNMTDANAEKLSKEVGALDRAIKKKKINSLNTKTYLKKTLDCTIHN